MKQIFFAVLAIFLLVSCGTEDVSDQNQVNRGDDPVVATIPLPSDLPELNPVSGKLQHIPVPKFVKMDTSEISEEDEGYTELLLWSKKPSYKVGETGNFYLRLTNHSKYDRKFAFEGVCHLFFQVNLNDVDVLNSKRGRCNVQEVYELVVPGHAHAYWQYDVEFSDGRFHAEPNTYILGTISGVGVAKASFKITD